MKMLSLPSFDYKVKRDGDQIQIFDPVRKRYVVLTPEEWVRQHMIHYLADHLHYPLQLMAVEKEIDLNDLKRRFDILCYDRELTPRLIVECKAPSIKLSQATFDQVFKYNCVVAARYVVITNGCEHYCGELTDDGCSFRMISEIPLFV